MSLEDMIFNLKVYMIKIKIEVKTNVLILDDTLGLVFTTSIIN